MREGAASYLLSVTAASMLLNLTQAILPKGTVRNIAGFIGGLLVVLAVLSPIGTVDIDEAIQPFCQFRTEKEAFAADAAVLNRDVMADIIKQQCETYILDKAVGLGMDIDAEVTLDHEDTYPVPASVVLTGKAAPEQKAQLAEYIARELGIPVEKQEWIVR